MFFALFSLAFSLDINGRIIDGHSNEPLPFASLFLADLEVGVQSDALGNFLFKNIPEGTHIIQATYLGYEIFKTSKSFHAKQNDFVEVKIYKLDNGLNSYSISKKRIDGSLTKEPKQIRSINSIFSFHIENLHETPAWYYSVGAQIRYSSRMYLGFLKSDQYLNICVSAQGAAIGIGVSDDNSTLIDLSSVHALGNFIYKPTVTVNLVTKEVSLGASMVILL